MQFTQAFDLVISLVLIFFLFSTVASGILEVFNQHLKRRNKNLQDALRNAFSEQGADHKTWYHKLISHPLISGLTEKTNPSGPSYIPSEVFSKALIEIVSRETALSDSLTADQVKVQRLIDFKTGIADLDPDHERETIKLLNSLALNSSSLTDLQTNIEKWYDDYMDRVSGWFKRKSKAWLFGISFILAVFLNVDTLRLADYYLKNDQERNKLVKAAGVIVDAGNPEDNTGNNSIDRALGSMILIDSLGIPIGWRSYKEIGLITNKFLQVELDSLILKKKEKLDEITKRFCKDEICCKRSKKSMSKYSSDKCNTDFNCLIATMKMDELYCSKTDSIRKDSTKCLPKLDSKHAHTLAKEYLKMDSVFEALIKQNRDQYTGSIKIYEDGTKSEIIKKSWWRYHFGDDAWDYVIVLFGWLITAYAGSQGASFWFQYLVRFVNIRNNGLKPKASNIT